MPPLKKYTKEEIINVAYKIVEEEGFDGINARHIAKKLGCSVQPIFHNFTSMEEVKKEVTKKMYNKYKEYMTNHKNPEKVYKQQGMSYIKFARDYKEFFKILFMQPTNLEAEAFITSDSASKDIITSGQKLTGFSYEKQKKFHVRVWIFTHGLACLVAMGTIKVTESELENLLETTVREMLIGYKKEGERK